MFTLIPILRDTEDEGLEKVEIVINIHLIVLAEPFLTEDEEEHTLLYYKKTNRDVLELEVPLSVEQFYSLIEDAKVKTWWRN